MKRTALLRIAALTLPALALAPAAAWGAESAEAVRASFGQGNLFASLSPLQGAIVTGLVVFALGCVVAVVVARRLDRAPGQSRKLDPDESFDRAVPALFSFQGPSSFRRASVMASPPRLLAAPSPAPVPAAPPSAPTVTGASSARFPTVDANEAPEHTLVGFPPPANLPADRPSQRETRIVERSGVVPSARAIGLGMISTGIVIDAEVVYEPGDDPDATTQFVRGHNLAIVEAARALEAETSKSTTMLPPAKTPTIRPIPISAPRSVAMAPANVSDLSFDDSPTEIGAPLFEEMHRELAKSSEVRALGGVSADETQAFMLVKSG